MSPRSDLQARIGVSVDHAKEHVLIYDHMLGTTIGLPIDMAEILLDELRYHVANARLHTLDEES